MLRQDTYLDIQLTYSSEFETLWRSTVFFF